MTAVDPRAIPVRFTNLKAMSRSPRHYLHQISEPRADSTAMRTGRLVHWNVLGGMPDEEEGEVRIYDGERRGNAWKEYEEANAGHEIVTAKEWARSLPIGDAVREDEVARQFLRGDFERPIKWDIGGRVWSSRLDILCAGHFIGDLKTTTDASPHAFAKQAWRMMYHAQMAAYQDAARAIGIDCPDAYLIGVEVRAPYAVTVLRLTPGVLEEGRRAYRGWFERLKVCEENDYWPSYVQHCATFDVPEWFSNDVSDDEDEEEEAAA